MQLSSSSIHIILLLQLLPPPTSPIINEGTPKINNCATINIHKTTSISTWDCTGITYKGEYHIIIIGAVSGRSSWLGRPSGGGRESGYLL